MIFSYDQRPVRVVFAPGALNHLPTELATLGAHRAFVVSTQRQATRPPSLDRLLGSRLAGTFDRAVEHVPVAVVDAALVAVRAANADVCVAIGGGSPIGLGKAIARATDLPLVAVPTTYSGSEMTSIWGVTDDTGKRTGRDARVAPRLVIYDPDLTLSLPPGVSAASGMNAMAHAVEAMYAANPSPASLAIAEESVRLLAANLPSLLENPNDDEARSGALAGAHLAGCSLDLAAMGLHHRLCHVLGGTFGLPHARTHAAVLPHVVAFNAPAAPHAMRRLGNALGNADPADALFALAKSLGVAVPLSALGLREADIDRAAQQATATPYPNPRPYTRDDVRSILQGAI